MCGGVEPHQGGKRVSAKREEKEMLHRTERGQRAHFFISRFAVLTASFPLECTFPSVSSCAFTVRTLSYLVTGLRERVV